VDGSVRFLGRQSRSDLVELYQNALCFVLSSDEEGLGIVILEAMACGRPVVSTECGGPGTLIVDEETGFLTPIGDAERLGEKIARLVENTDLRTEMGGAARKRAETMFSVEAAKQPFLRAYSDA
jgi:glycosyltransferase involved in cell wall biosynthesis